MKFAVLASAFLVAVTRAATLPASEHYELNKRALSSFGGVNCYMLALLTDDQLSSVMSNIKASGAKVIRTWGFHDVTDTNSSVYYQAFTSSGVTINTGSNGLQRLDAVVAAAESAGIQLIIPFVNNWSDYGGMAAYLTYCGGAQTGWYTNTECQTAYQAYIKAVVSRYSSSSAVLAWELANEPRCNGCATSVITEWATTTSAYIKSLDSSHLVTMGDEGFGLNGSSSSSSSDYPYTDVEGLDFAANLAIPDIDFGTMHLYPNGWGESDSGNWGAQWIEDHAAAANKVGKPVILEEFGSQTHSNELSWEAAAVNTSGVQGSLIWQYGDSTISGYDDGYMVMYGTSEFTQLVTDHIAAMNAKD